MGKINDLVDTISGAVINPLLLLFFAIGTLAFFFGVVEFLFNLNRSGTSSGIEKGRKHMIYGLVGMFVMTAAWAIVEIIRNTFPPPSSF